MDWLPRLFGPPHELLHLLALRIIGRRPARFTWRYVDIPPDLSKSEYLFVAALPAVIFWGLGLIGALSLVSAGDVGSVVLSMIVMMLGMLAGLGTLGDIQRIIERLREPS